MNTTTKTPPAVRDNDRTVVDAITLHAPATRLLLIQAFYYQDAKGEQSGAHVYPVVAIQASTQRNYSKRAAGYRALPSPNHKELDALGWSFEGQGAHLDVIIAPGTADTPDLISGTEFDCSNTSQRTIAAPWPAAEDDERLKDVIAEMIEEARQRETGQRPEGR